MLLMACEVLKLASAPISMQTVNYIHRSVSVTVSIADRNMVTVLKIQALNFGSFCLV